MPADDDFEFGSAHPERRSWLSRLLLACLVLGAVAVVIIHPGQGAAHDGSGANHPGRAGAAGLPARPPIVITAGHRLLGVTGGWQLFARGPGDLVSVQLARGRVTWTAVPQLESGNPDVIFLVGPHEAIVRSADFVPGYVIPDGSGARLLTGPLADGGPLISGPDPGHAWIISGAPTDPSFSLVSLDGRSAGPFIHVPLGEGPIHVPLGDGPLPGTAVPDGRGYVLMETSTSGLFDAGPTWDRPVSGDVIAIGSARWLVVACDVSYQHCHNEVTDPATWTQRQLPGAPVPGLAGLYYPDWPPLGVVSPDGSIAAVPVTDNSGNVTLHLIDLRSGADRAVPVQLAATPSNECMAWSPDGTWLFVAASGGRLLAVNARSRHVQGLGVTLPQITQVAVRDAAG